MTSRDAPWRDASEEVAHDERADDVRDQGGADLEQQGSYVFGVVTAFTPHMAASSAAVMASALRRACDGLGPLVSFSG